MRKYYDDYERGYEDGRLSVLEEFDLDEFDDSVNDLYEGTYFDDFSMRPKVKEAANWLQNKQKELVPKSGKADSKEGEILRLFSKIVARYFNEGDLVSDLKAEVSALTELIKGKGRDRERKDIKDCLRNLKIYSREIRKAEKAKDDLEADYRNNDYRIELGNFCLAVYDYLK